MSYAAASKEGSHCLDHFVELRRGEFGKNGQRQHFERRAFGLGTLPLQVPEIREARLQVQRERIVDRAADTAILEMRLQRLALRHPDRVLVVDRGVGGIDKRRDYIGEIGERCIVVRSIASPSRTPGFEMRQFGA
jgi:hypothetical protein